MNKELREKLEIPGLIEYDYSGKPKCTHRVTKSNGKYLVENIEKPHLNHPFDTVNKLYEELLMENGGRHSADTFDDQTGEDIFKNFPKKGIDF